MFPIILPVIKVTGMAIQVARMAPVACTACALIPAAFGIWKMGESRYIPSGVTKTINITFQATASVGFTSNIANIISRIFGLPSEWTFRGLIVIRDTISNGISSLRQKNDNKALDGTVDKMGETATRINKIHADLTKSNELIAESKESLAAHQVVLEKVSKADDEHAAQLNVMVGTALLVNNAVNIAPALLLKEQLEEKLQETQEIEASIAQQKASLASTTLSIAKSAAMTEETAHATGELKNEISELTNEAVELRLATSQLRGTLADKLAALKNKGRTEVAGQRKIVNNLMATTPKDSSTLQGR